MFINSLFRQSSMIIRSTPEDLIRLHYEIDREYEIGRYLGLVCMIASFVVLIWSPAIWGLMVVGVVNAIIFIYGVSKGAVIWLDMIIPVLIFAAFFLYRQYSGFLEDR